MAKKKNFEEAFRRLEEIAELLEAGDVSLDESMKLYEEGMELINFCGKKLEDAETVIQKLSKSADGSLEASAANDLLSES